MSTLMMSDMASGRIPTANRMEHVIIIGKYMVIVPIKIFRANLMLDLPLSRVCVRITKSALFQK